MATIHSIKATSQLILERGHVGGKKLEGGWDFAGVDTLKKNTHLAKQVREILSHMRTI